MFLLRKNLLASPAKIKCLQLPAFFFNRLNNYNAIAGRSFHRKLGNVKKTLSASEQEHKKKLEENLELDKEQSFFKTFADDEIYFKMREL